MSKRLEYPAMTTAICIKALSSANKGKTDLEIATQVTLAMREVRDSLPMEYMDEEMLAILHNRERFILVSLIGAKRAAVVERREQGKN